MKWTEEEIEYVINNYENTSKEEMLNKLNGKTWKSIKHVGNKFNIKRITKFNNEWKEYEINYLIKNYENTSKDELIGCLNGRTWTSIKLMGRKLGLYRSNDFNRKSNMNKLLENNNNAFYWMGFLSADGHFNQNDSRVKLILAIKDKEHLTKFANFVETDNMLLTENTCSVSIQNIDLFDELCEKFNLNHNKTYLPPNFDLFNKYNKELFFSYIIGFIDGDGYINKLYKRKDCNLGIHLHKSWLNNLIHIENFLYNYFNLDKKKTFSKIGKDDYARMIISNGTLISEIKKEVLRLNLPFMNRKWDIIDETHVSKYEMTKVNKEIVINLYLTGLNGKDIINKTKLKKGVVYSYIRETKKESI